MSAASQRLRQRASARHRVAIEAPELNLNSMMDLFAVLIPCLLMMSAVVEVTLLNIAVPSLGGAPAEAAAKPPLDLTLTVLPSGYRLSTQDGILLGTSDQATPVGSVDPQAVSLPLIKQRLRCGHYHDTRPPPRRRNAELPACEAASDSREFWLYDTAGLTARMVALKNQHPEARRIVIDAAPEVEYESVIDVMDATRDTLDANGQTRLLFDEVLLSPGIQG